MPLEQEKVIRRVYDGATMCCTEDCCPVVEELEGGMIRIHDPAKPDSGSFTMTRIEYNLLLANAQPVA